MQLTQNDMKTQRVVFKAFYAESGIPSKTVDKTGIQHHPVKVTPILIGSVDTKKKKKTDTRKNVVPITASEETVLYQVHLRESGPPVRSNCQ